MIKRMCVHRCLQWTHGPLQCWAKVLNHPSLLYISIQVQTFFYPFKGGLINNWRRFAEIQKLFRPFSVHSLDLNTTKLKKVNKYKEIKDRPKTLPIVSECHGFKKSSNKDLFVKFSALGDHLVEVYFMHQTMLSLVFFINSNEDKLWLCNKLFVSNLAPSKLLTTWRLSVTLSVLTKHWLFCCVQAPFSCPKDLEVRV